jgi:hypothetical protein
VWNYASQEALGTDFCLLKDLACLQEIGKKQNNNNNVEKVNSLKKRLSEVEFRKVKWNFGK